MKKKVFALALALSLSLSLAACGSASSGSAVSGSASGSGSAASSGETVTLKVAASPTPHAEILEQVKPILAEQGIDLVIDEYSDYVVPNTAVEDGLEDANYFQHTPYLDQFNEENGTHLVSVGKIHYEPFGIYPCKTSSLEDLADGAIVAVPNDATNEARALLLLEANGLITLKDDAGLNATPNDIVDNPKNLQFKELEAAMLPTVTSEVDIAAINGYDILTTIDVQIQDILETELYNMCVEQEPEWATAVLMDVKTGDIKAISNLSWNETAHDYIETVNHAVRSWELGSVMKPISLAIAIEDGFVHASTPVTIGASFPYAQARPITDTHSIGANPTVTEVLAGSSNIGTARIITSHYGEKPWEFRKRLEEIGFFESLNIGISGESRPTIQPLGSPDKRMENPWRINLSRCCYGYAVQQSPVTNLAIINAIANDGKFVRPRLVKELWRNDSLIKSNPVSYVRKQAFSPKTASEVRSMLRAVVWSDRKGVPTAPRLQNNFVEIAGKTGTARIMEPGVGYTNKLRVTFTGFFPYDKPMYSCIVVFNAPRIRSAQLVSGRVLMNTALKMYARGMLGNKSDFRKEDDNTHRAPTLMAMSSDKTTRVLSQMKAKSYSQMKSKGNEKGMVPNVLGMGLRDAVATLERCGVTVTKISGSGYVTQQIPAAGSPLRKGTKATLHLNN